MNKLYFDALAHDPATLDYLIGLVGADQVAMGSDYPFPLGEFEPGKLIETSAYDDEIKAKLLHGTALKWLGLDKNDLTS